MSTKKINIFTKPIALFLFLVYKCIVSIMINTYSESQLHKELKNLYATKYKGKTEQSVMGKICDILTKEGHIIEIQTQNLGKLTNKIDIFTSKYPVRIVYPLVIKKTIETFSPEGDLLSKRQSPKKQNINCIFKELTSLYPFLLGKGLVLEILETSITEIRIKTNTVIQLENKSRRYKKEWYKKDKKLTQIHSTYTFETEKDYLALFPKNLPAEFSAQDLCSLGVGKEAHCMIWVYKRMGLIEFTEKKGRRNYFRLTSKK